MFIKRVAIQGFKTFAKRTEFLFDAGITAVVGPNGSGKSNIVDSIRWCLGEQSYSMLRSKKTSDVIFSGSDKKARLGMAEVVLTLDNSAGQLPLDFTEIEITRRAYRDGDNEYLLNGKRVRLQDITDLLAQTGLSRRTYAVVGQGLIDRVLNLTPEERRSLFEEAAGITGYQFKRTTTLNRLEAAQQNLTRVNDILAELTPRLKYLKRQAERAQEYAAVANDLRSMLRDWYGFRWHTTIHQLEQNRRIESESQAIVHQWQAALRVLEGQLETLRAQHATLRHKLADLHQQSSSCHQEAEQSGRELAVGRERLHQLQARRDEADREVSALKQEQATQEERLAEVQQSLSMAETTLHERQAAVSAIQAVVDQRQQERAGLQSALDAARQELQRVQRQRVNAESRLQQLSERREALQHALDEQQHNQQAAAAEAEKRQAALATAERMLQQTEENARQTQQQLHESQMQQKSEQEALATAEREQQTIARTLDRLQTRHDLLKRLHEEGAGYASGVRAVLQAGREKTGAGHALTGILGVVGSLVQVPAQLDKAIETALGGALQNVITATWQVTQQAIEFLKRTGRGRATFLPLDRLSVLSAIPAPQVSGILGNAADLVDYDSQIEDAIRQLLNRTWVAEDLPAARRALDNYRGQQRPTVVTLDGEIIRPGGAVTGGNDSNRRDESILARERELRELPQQIKQREAQLQAQQAQCTAQQNALNATTEAISTAQRALADLARQERQQRQGREEAQRQVDRAQQTVRWHGERETQTADELQGLASQTATLRAEAERWQTEEVKAGAALTTAEVAVEQAGVSELLQQLADLRAAAAEAQTNLRNQRQLLESQERTLQRLAQQQQSRRANSHKLAEEAHTLGTRIATLASQEEGLRTAIEALRQQIEPLESAVAALEEERTAKESTERETQGALRKDESSWTNARLQLQRSEDALQQLQHEIEQDLGFVIFQESEALAYQPPLPWETILAASQAGSETIIEQLPVVESLPAGFDDEVRETRARLSRISNVNPEALREYEEAADRHSFLTTQSSDLEAAIADMRKVIKELDALMKAALQETFTKVAEQFVHFFQLLFNGGTAQLLLTTPDDITNTGIEIIARPPGKRPQSLALLSGGERTLAACALIFAILRVSPTPFCVLDEVDAALDEANVDRFRLTVESLSDNTQFIIVTHNRRTLEGASAIYGVTMGNDGISRVISLKLEGDRMVQHGNGVNGDGVADLQKIEEFVKL
ncbi:MAG: chromosome segregation protein SMC [Caldilineaceae bacterium]